MSIPCHLSSKRIYIHLYIQFLQPRDMYHKKPIDSIGCTDRAEFCRSGAQMHLISRVYLTFGPPFADLKSEI